MEATIEIDIDEITREVIESSEFESQVDDIVRNNLRDLDDSIENIVADAVNRLDIDDIGDFERRVEEIVEDALDSAVTSSADMLLAERVAALEAQVSNLIEALDRSSDLLKVLLKVGNEAV